MMITVFFHLQAALQLTDNTAYSEKVILYLTFLDKVLIKPVHKSCSCILYATYHETNCLINLYIVKILYVFEIVESIFLYCYIFKGKPRVFTSSFLFCFSFSPCRLVETCTPLLMFTGTVYSLVHVLSHPAILFLPVKVFASSRLNISSGK
jgi:hypothetical protein